MRSKFYPFIVLSLVLSLVLTGCLDFGEDLETTAPTPIQVERCRAEMYLNPSLDITPLGFKLQGSGIDDAIWFKFATNASEIQDIFNAEVVDTSQFQQGVTLNPDSVQSPWWDVNGKTLLGGQIELPNVRFMNVGIEKSDAGYVVYIMWHEV